MKLDYVSCSGSVSHTKHESGKKISNHPVKIEFSYLQWNLVQHRRSAGTTAGGQMCNGIQDRVQQHK